MFADVLPPGTIFTSNINSGAELAAIFGDPTSADPISAARAPNAFIQPNSGVTSLLLATLPRNRGRAGVGAADSASSRGARSHRHRRIRQALGHLACALLLPRKRRVVLFAKGDVDDEARRACVIERDGDLEGDRARLSRADRSRRRGRSRAELVVGGPEPFEHRAS